MVPVTEDWIKDMITVGEYLSGEALRHDIDIIDIRVEPEFGYIYVKGTKVDNTGSKMQEVFHAIHWENLGTTDIKVAPQGTAIPTGASN